MKITKDIIEVLSKEELKKVIEESLNECSHIDIKTNHIRQTMYHGKKVLYVTYNVDVCEYCGKRMNFDVRELL